VVVSIPSSNSFTVGAGLTYSTNTVDDNTVYIFTGGTDTITIG
jgi:hypothetical protein